MDKDATGSNPLLHCMVVSVVIILKKINNILYINCYKANDYIYLFTVMIHLY